MKTFRILAAALLASASVGMAHAQTAKSDTTIKGSLTQTTELDGLNLVTSAGKGDAGSNIGAIYNSNIAGSVVQNTKVQGVNMVTSMGDGSASSDIGVIANANISGKATQTTTVKGANTVTSMDKGDACSTIGSVGKPCASKGIVDKALSKLGL